MIEDKNAEVGYFYYKGDFSRMLYNWFVKSYNLFLSGCGFLFYAGTNRTNPTFSDNVITALCIILGGLTCFLGTLVLFLEFVLLSLLFLIVQFFYILSGFFFLLFEKTVLYWYKISVLCPKCNKKVTNPVYLCPKCNAEHVNLVPSIKYGIFKRKCSCGEKMPSFLLGKKKLKAKCPHCSGSIEPLEYSPHTIAFIGGKSVGKTFLRNVMSVSLSHIVNERAKRNTRKGHSFFEKIACFFHNWYANRYCWRVHIPDAEKSKVNAIEDDLRKGMRPNETQLGVSTPAIRIDLKRGYRSIPERLYLFDAPGEAFTKEDYMNSYFYYESLQTLVIVIDPLSLPNINLQLANAKSIKHISTESPHSCISKWLNSMQRVHTDGDLEVLQDVRCAIVITKVDMPEFNKLSNLTVNSTSEECRSFLEGNDARIISLVENHFREVNFFAVSCTGGKMEGTAFSPEGLDKLWEWILDK